LSGRQISRQFQAGWQYPADGQVGRVADIQADRQAGRQADRQVGRRTDKQMPNHGKMIRITIRFFYFSIRSMSLLCSLALLKGGGARGIIQLYKFNENLYFSFHRYV